MSSILVPERHAWGVHPAASFGLLIDADDYYREFYHAALRAKRYLLLAGWQFDSDVALLRGEHVGEAPGPTTLLEFLDSICERNPDLLVYILAWDFHAVFAIEREWLQEFVFEWNTKDRVQFRFDAHHVDRGCHHQKFVVVDGEVAFLGGLDLCDHRWDDTRHLDPNPLRTSRGAPHKPFHDVQAYVHGAEVSAALTHLFVTRWELAGGERITLPALGAPTFPEYHPACGLPLPARQIAISRTDPQGSPEGTPNVLEIRAIYLDAIAAAERLIYVETQYFSSNAVTTALEERLRAPDRSRLEVVLVLNRKGETMKEQIAVGLAQAQSIERIRAAAEGTNHHVGIYYTLPSCETGVEPEHATYIHSKLMIVDDVLLTVGSANLTNRSLSVDTELNATVEAERPDDDLSRCIRKVRAQLLGEHTGGEPIDDVDGLVARLDGIANAGDPDRGCRLKIHDSPTEGERAALRVIDPQQLPFDPDTVEEMTADDRSVFVGGIGALWKLVFGAHSGERA